MGTPFSVTVSFDKPAGLPAAATDVIDFHILLGDAGTLGALRVVASVDINTSTAGLDFAQVNLAQKLWLTEISVVGFPIPGLNALFANLLRQSVKSIPLVPFPVNHNETSTILMKNADIGIIDDTSPADKDASAFLITFGGGNPGTRTAFTQSFVSPGGNAGIAVSMAWICRVISPMIDTSLHLDGAFTNCRLTRTVRIDEDNEVDLTGLSITEEDGFLGVKVTVSKSGFCYSASGTVGAKIKVAVVNNQLIVKAEVDNPNVDVDIPWYCYLAGAVIGALLGGLLPGVIFAIVGAVLVPLIMYVAQEVIEGTINSVAARVADALNSIAPSVDIPAVGFDLIFSDAFIDDVQIVGQVRPRDTAVVRSSGTVSVPSGAAFDLDSGTVGARDMPSGDLTVLGGPLDRTVRAVCGARWARTGLRDFNGLFRSAVYPYTYAAPNPVPLAELATLNPFGVVYRRPVQGNQAHLRRAHQRRPVGGGAGRGGDACAHQVPVHHLGEGADHGADRRWFRLPDKAVRQLRRGGQTGFCGVRPLAGAGRVGRRHGRHATTGSLRFVPRCGARCDAARGSGQGRRPDCRCDSRTTPDRSTHRHVRRRVRVAETPTGPIRCQDSRFRDGPEGERGSSTAPSWPRPVAT